MPEVLVLQHMACEPLGTIEAALHQTDLSHRYIRAQESDPVPQEIGDAAGLIILGGPMGAYEQDKYPFLADELRLIASAVSKKAPILGVCLGGQMLAYALGAAVRPGPQKEIGWHSVTLAAEAAEDALWQGLPPNFTGYHWHGDYFALPRGAVSLASSALTPCQAFRYGDFAYGFQFHLEVTEAIIREWTAAFANELAEAGLEADSSLSGLSKYLLSMQEIAQEVFGRWAAIAARRV